jgi:hypothetical protein
MIGPSWLLLALGGAVHATEFELDTDSPDALCPELSMTREVVRRRLGELETEGGGRWHGLYSTVHDPTGRRGDYVRLVIRDARGKEHLNRELPLKGESCETLAQAIALVVDGFFRELAQAASRDDTVDGPAPSQERGGTVTSTERANTPAPVASISSTPAPRRISDHSPSLPGRKQAGTMLGSSYESVPAKAALSLGVFVTQPERWRMQLQAGLPFAELRDDRGAGTATAYVVPVRWSFSYVLQPLKGMQWLIGPEAILSIERGAARNVPNGRHGWRVSPGLGAQIGLAYWVTQSVALGTSVSFDQMLFQSRSYFMYGEPVLEFSSTRVSATLGLWAAIWP